MGDASAPIDVARKWAELKAKASSLRSEMLHWQELTADKTQPFTKHHSQVRRICGRIEGLLDAVDCKLDPRDGLLGRAGQIQNDLLKAHAIWEFYRSKLILRADSFLGSYLRVCDEFAWGCYYPAQKLFREAIPEAERETLALKIEEPPFVFLNGVSSPYAVPREKDFSAEMATGGWSMSGVPPRVLEKLPAPMIGLPWYQVSHLPDALVIGHEIGHVAEWDFRLTKATQDAITAAGTEEEGAWMSWRSEIFADVYGCLAGGPSFVRTLVDFLLAEVMTVQKEQRTPNVWGQYPPVWLRVALVLETLSRSFPGDAEEIRNTWQSKYGVADDKDKWEKDKSAVIDQLLRPISDARVVQANRCLELPHGEWRSQRYSGRKTDSSRPGSLRYQSARPACRGPPVVRSVSRKICAVGPGAESARSGDPVYSRGNARNSRLGFGCVSRRRKENRDGAVLNSADFIWLPGLLG
jgi:hypothetical protein